MSCALALTLAGGTQAHGKAAQSSQDDCTSTLVHVNRGVVDVFDFALHKHVSVGAGQTYVAHAP